MKHKGVLFIAWLIVAALLFDAAVERHPYSFDTLLRWICCPVFAYSAFAAYENKHGVWVWVFGVLAALYNPIFRVHLDRSTWIGVNCITVGIIAVAGICLPQSGMNPTYSTNARSSRSQVSMSWSRCSSVQKSFDRWPRDSVCARIKSSAGFRRQMW